MASASQESLIFFESSELTVSCPAGVTLRAVGRVGRGDGGHAGAPDEAEGGEATRSGTAGGETWRAQARLARFGKQRLGGCGLRLGCSCGGRGRSEDLIW